MVTAKKYKTDTNTVYTLEKDGRRISGSLSYLAQRIGVKKTSIQATIWKLKKGKAYRVAGWTITRECVKGGTPLEFQYPDPTVGDAVKEAEVEQVDKPVKVEGRYLLRGGKENRQCWMCALYYRPQLCAKHNDLCADDGIFLDTDARVCEQTY